MKKLVVGILGLLLLTGIFTVHAQGEEGVVYAVLFYSPTCPHCHKVITEDIPPLTEQYGDQFQVLYIDVTQSAGAALFYEACDIFNVPEDRCGSVPNMIIGETVMIGSVDIPAQMPQLVADGIQNDGIPIPQIPTLIRAWEAENGAPSDHAGNSESEAAAISTTVNEKSWQDKFEEDLTANSLAVVVLAGLALSLMMILLEFVSKDEILISARTRWWIMLMVAGGALLMAGTLVLAQAELTGASLLAVLITVALMWIIAILWEGRSQNKLPNWLFPMVAVVGLLVAGYLVYIEVGENEAVCGAVGNCNLVQQSDYAELFGVLPIGVLGVVGYLVMLGVWYINQRTNSEQIHALLFGLTIVGAAFSAYLTFLEPFVIGASCAWCLTSAMLMLLLLWLQAPTGIQALQHLRR